MPFGSMQTYLPNNSNDDGDNQMEYIQTYNVEKSMNINNNYKTIELLFLVVSQTTAATPSTTTSTIWQNFKVLKERNRKKESWATHSTFSKI